MLGAAEGVREETTNIRPNRGVLRRHWGISPLLPISRPAEPRPCTAEGPRCGSEGCVGLGRHI